VQAEGFSIEAEAERDMSGREIVHIQTGQVSLSRCSLSLFLRRLVDQPSERVSVAASSVPTSSRATTRSDTPTSKKRCVHAKEGLHRQRKESRSGAADFSSALVDVARIGGAQTSSVPTSSRATTRSDTPTSKKRCVHASSQAGSHVPSSSTKRKQKWGCRFFERTRRRRTHRWSSDYGAYLISSDNTK
jgi:hypothetical protein